MALSAEELIEKATDQRRRDRHQEAASSARLATEKEPDSPEAWWEFGLALLNCEDLRGSAEAFKRLTELAPAFAQGWGFYGLVLSDLGTQDEARSALEMAFELGCESQGVLRALARRYAAAEDDAGEYAVLKRLQELGFIESSRSGIKRRSICLRAVSKH